jgi:hypothetical protein
MKENILAQQELLKSNIATLYGIDRDQIEKGSQRAMVGEVREYGGKKYVKHTDGWVYVADGKAHVYNGKITASNAKEAESHHIDHYHESVNKDKKVEISKKDEMPKSSDDKFKESEGPAKEEKIPIGTEFKSYIGGGKKIRLKVVGYTKSDKPIYSSLYARSKDVNDYKYFSKQDHLDASDHYTKTGDRLSKEYGEDVAITRDARTNALYHKNEALKLKKSEENTIKKSHASDAFRYSDSNAFKIDLTGEEIKEKCESAIPYLYAQKQGLKEIAQDALNQCDSILPDSPGKQNNISYSTFSYELTEPQRDQYTDKYPEQSNCQKQMSRYNSAIYQMIDIANDIKVLETLKSTLSDEKTYSLTLNQIVAISMGYTEDEFAEKAIKIEIEKGGEGSKGGKVIGHTASGKPIYASKQHEAIMDSHFNFSAQSHLHKAKLLTQQHNKLKSDLANGKYGQGASANSKLNDLKSKAKLHTEVADIKNKLNRVEKSESENILENKNSSAAMNYPNL